MPIASDDIVSGHCDRHFEPLLETFRGLLQSGEELGGAVAVYHRGHKVVDLWGGTRDRDSGAPWEESTFSCMMSVSKGIAMLCLAMLADRKLLSVDDPMARHWPEFAQNGKADVTIRQAFGHLAGIPYVDGVREGDMYDWDVMVAAIARQQPVWPVGSRQVYHSSTLGFMAGELVRRLTGRTIGTFLREEICGPLQTSFFFGLTPAEQAQCATMIKSAGNVVSAAKRAAPDSIEAKIWASLPADEDFNSPLWREREIPSVNGQGTARAIARIYGALAAGGVMDGHRLLDMASIAPFLVQQKPDPIPPEGLRLRMAVGFMLNSPPSRPMGPHLATFGHSGAGGAQGFCDPVSGIGFCYTTCRMHDGADAGVRATSLIDALYASSGLD